MLAPLPSFPRKRESRGGPIRLAQQENENGLMEAPCPHGALSSKERDEDIPPPLIFNDIQRFSREYYSQKLDPVFKITSRRFFMKSRFLFSLALFFLFLSCTNWAAEPVRVQKNSISIEITKQVAPKYPVEAKKNHITGQVVLDATVNELGKVIAVKATKSADPQLEAAAIEAVKQWEYAPLKMKGKAVSFITSIEVNFALDATKPAPNN
jgi:TonB family protein